MRAPTLTKDNVDAETTRIPAVSAGTASGRATRQNTWELE